MGSDHWCFPHLQSTVLHLQKGRSRNTHLKKRIGFYHMYSPFGEWVFSTRWERERHSVLQKPFFYPELPGNRNQGWVVSNGFHGYQCLHGGDIARGAVMPSTPRLLLMQLMWWDLESPWQTQREAWIEGREECPVPLWREDVWGLCRLGELWQDCCDMQPCSHVGSYAWAKATANKQLD